MASSCWSGRAACWARKGGCNDARSNKRAAAALIWLLLLALPYLAATGSAAISELGTRVLVLALAAMSLNFLLGFTGVLSFGHAAYFGLGAYGVGMTIKYLVPSTPLGILSRRARRHHRRRDHRRR